MVVFSGKRGTVNILRHVVEAFGVVGATAVADGDTDVALVAGLTYGGLLAIIKAIVAIVREIRKARERRKG